MIAYLAEKFRNFLFSCFIYLVMGVLLGLITTFLIMPMVGYFRFGVIQFLPSPVFAIKMVKATIYASLFLALIMWLWAEWETKEQRDAASKPKNKESGNKTWRANPVDEVRDMRNTITVSDLPSPSSTQVPTLSALARGAGAPRSKPSVDKSSSSSGQ